MTDRFVWQNKSVGTFEITHSEGAIAITELGKIVACGRYCNRGVIFAIAPHNIRKAVGSLRLCIAKNLKEIYEKQLAEPLL